MKDKKGFTLVELLAIIVVLAVLAIVAVPVLTNVIRDSKIKAFQTKIYALEKAAETYYDDLILEDEFDVFERGLDGTYALTIDLSDKEQVKKLNIKTFNKGMLTITEDGDISITAIEDNYCGQKLHSSNVVNMLNIKEDFTCYLLNSSSGDLGTQDILSAIQNLKTSNEDLTKKVEDLTKSNKDLKESIKNLSDNGIGSITALNKIYPVGSIYVSTTLKNAEEVEKALGGKWESYGDGKVLRGTTGTSGQTGGLSEVSLTTANLPEHSHSYTPAGTIKSTFTGSSATTSSTGSGYTLTYNTTGTNNASTGNQSANHTHSIPELTGTAASAGAHKHSVTPAGTVSSTFTGSAVNSGYTGNGYSIGHTYTGRTTGSNVAINTTEIYSYKSGAGNHFYPITWNGAYVGSDAQYAEKTRHTHTYNDYYANSISGVESHRHTVTAAGTVSSSFTGTAVNTNSKGAHTHSVTTTASTSGENSVNHTHKYTNKYVTGLSGVGAHTHTVTAKGSVASTFTGTTATTGKTGSNTAFSVLDPYITVYMYKRVE